MTNYHVIAKLATDSSGRQKAQVNNIPLVSRQGSKSVSFFDSFKAKRDHNLISLKKVK